MAVKVCKKLQQARALLCLSQREAAAQSGTRQQMISILERGSKKFIPTEYLQFLCGKGIDLNALFNEQVDEVRFVRKGMEAVPPQ
jgi:transcriptional regulator with XRE-family HTH domain